MFKQSKRFPPVTVNANPRDYHLWKDTERGNPAYVMSRSSLIEFARCPSKWKCGTERKETDAMSFGSLVDCLILDPARFAKDYIVQPDKYQPEKGDPKPWSNNATVCREWNEQQKAAGKDIVCLEDLEEARKCVIRITSNERLAEIIDSSAKQVMVCVDWHDSETGFVIPFISLIDLLPDAKSKPKFNTDLERSIFDLKTSRDAEYNAWRRQVFNDKLYYQAGCYTLAVNAATGLKYERFGHLIIENTAPYEPTSRLLSEEFLELGVAAFEHDMRHYCKCLKKGWFEGYDSKWVEPEVWMINQI